MSWQKYTPVVKARPSEAVSISVPDSSSRSSPFLMIDDVTMKELGWKAGGTLMLSIGLDEHAGKLRLESATGESLRIGQPGGRSKRNRITLGRLPCLGDDRVKSACQFLVVKTAGGGRRFGRHASRCRALAPVAARHGGGHRRGQR